MYRQKYFGFEKGFFFIIYFCTIKLSRLPKFSLQMEINNLKKDILLKIHKTA